MWHCTHTASQSVSQCEAAPPTCRVLTTSCILARPRSRKLSIRSPSINPVACSVFRSVWKDLQVAPSQGENIDTLNKRLINSHILSRLFWSILKSRLFQPLFLMNLLILSLSNKKTKHFALMQCYYHLTFF